MIRFDSPVLATGAQGTFQTAPGLLAGSTYRVSIQRDGFAPFVSDWVTLGEERTTIPPIRLHGCGSWPAECKTVRAAPYLVQQSSCRPPDRPR